MGEQFFGKAFWVAFLGQAVFFALAILVFQTFLIPWVFLVIGIAVFFISYRRLEWGIAIAFAELFAHSHGHLLSTSLGGFSLSLRMIVFLAVLGAWMFLLLKKQVAFSWKDPRRSPFVLLGLAVLMGFALGLTHVPFAKAFQDGNAYFYLLYLFPILSLSWDQHRRLLLLQVLAGSAVWVTFLTLGLLYLFTHFPEWGLVEVYTFIRDTRTGELTKMTDGIFRIFLQSQFSVIVFFFLLMSFCGFKRSKKSLLLLAVLFSVILIGLSRSFWVGMLAGGAVFVLLFFVVHREQWKSALLYGASLFLVIPLSLVFLFGIVLFPYPSQFGSTGALSSLFSSRTTDADDVAVTSRWKLLGPMMEAIEEQPLFGHGFGKEVEFETDDPRIRAISPDGKRRTHAFEWGWLEIMIKMGLLGVTGFLLVFVGSVQYLRGLLRTPQAWLGIGLLSSLVFLYATHIFSPYLNHPIGLGFLLFLIPFYESLPPKKEAALASDPLLNKSMVQPNIAPTASLYPFENSLPEHSFLPSICNERISKK